MVGLPVLVWKQSHPVSRTIRRILHSTLHRLGPRPQRILSSRGLLADGNWSVCFRSCHSQTGLLVEYLFHLWHPEVLHPLCCDSSKPIGFELDLNVLELAVGSWYKHLSRTVRGFPGLTKALLCQVLRKSLFEKAQSRRSSLLHLRLDCQVSLLTMLLASASSAALVLLLYFANCFQSQACSSPLRQQSPSANGRQLIVQGISQQLLYSFCYNLESEISADYQKSCQSQDGTCNSISQPPSIFQQALVSLQ